VLLGALAAASGRFVLASTTRHFRGRFSAERRANLQAAEELLVGSRAKAAAGLGLFALSPVPSAQLFVAAGLLTVPLVPLTAAFFVGRLVSYSLYVAAARPGASRSRSRCSPASSSCSASTGPRSSSHVGAGTQHRSGRSGRFRPRRSEMKATAPASSGSQKRMTRYRRTAAAVTAAGVP